MTETRTAVIIGAGLIGLSTADSLIRRGVEVTVVDAHDGPVRGTSFSNSGMIHPSQARSWSPTRKATQAQRDAESATRDLAKDAMPRLLSRMEELGLQDMRARPRGCYQIFPDLDAARAAQTQLSADGITANVVIDPSRTFSKPALFFPEDRSGDAHAYGCALADDLTARGVTFIYGAGDVRMRWDSVPGRVAVSLAGHRFRADDVVICTGARSSEILAPLGLSARITPVRGWAVDFDLPADFRLPPTPVMDAVSRSALTVFEDRFRLSGTWNEDSARPLLERWAELIPDVLGRAKQARSVWSGLRPVSGAGRPYIGAAPIPADRGDTAGEPGTPSRLWVNIGHGHMGWTLCAGAGELAAAMITGEREDARFAYGG